MSLSFEFRSSAELGWFEERRRVADSCSLDLCSVSSRNTLEFEFEEWVRHCGKETGYVFVSFSFSHRSLRFVPSRRN